jgi:FkbH-like protein
MFQCTLPLLPPMITPAELAAVTERFLSSSGSARPDEFASLMLWLRNTIQAGDSAAAATVLRRVVLPDLDYTSTQSFCRIRRRLDDSQIHFTHTARLAVLGGFETKSLVALIELHLFAAGVSAEIYEADYGLFRQEILDPGSGLYEFAPQIVVLAVNGRDLAHQPGFCSDRDGLHGAAEAELADWFALWDTAHRKLGCQVIQNNIPMPSLRSFANHEMRQPGSPSQYVALINQLLAENAPSHVTIHDVDHLAATWGRANWGDPRFVHHAKLPCAPEYLADYAHSIASLIAAQLGFARKCLVLDLDNTLWGGVIGDDGLGGIRIGQGDPEGEAFLAFQKYVKSLQARGVILAVCSKNEDAIAREVFEKHSEMVLGLDDISCFIANWDDKATNVRTIARILGIGTDSLVFVDDSPMERAIVRRLVPEVSVPELPDDVTAYPQVLEQHRYFQVLAVGTEDFRRTEYYRSESMRTSAEAAIGDIDSFLSTLDMAACVGPIATATLERSVQLIQRSNQFNLTTRRRSASEVQVLLDDPAWVTRTVSLSDRFGDNGLISVLLAHVSGAVLEIDTWLMSCRVLKRGVEQFVLNELYRAARSQGITTIRGTYIPSPKNALVRDHYARLGFAQVGGQEGGTTCWELEVTDDWVPLPNWIAAIPLEGGPAGLPAADLVVPVEARDTAGGHRPLRRSRDADAAHPL